MTLNFVLLWLVTRMSEADAAGHETSSKLLKVSCLLLLAESLLFAVIAASKILLYISNFGFTSKRIQSLWLVGVLAAACLAWGIHLMSGKKTISVSWLDENEQPMPAEGELYYRVDYTYDKMGNINREKYYDAEGNPVRCKRGYAIVYKEYDAYNRVVYEKFYDTDGFAIMLDDGAVSYRYQYNENGELIQTTKYDYGDHEVE